MDLHGNNKQDFLTLGPMYVGCMHLFSHAVASFNHVL